jgi:DEAD/DEAH box helicase domain-containing protein
MTLFIYVHIHTFNRASHLRELTGESMSDGQTSARGLLKRSGSSAPRPKKRLKTDEAPSESSSDSNSRQGTSTWTAEFQQLDQLFRSLNTVYTFCCTRKHLPTTFDNLASSVSSLIKRFSSPQSVLTAGP